MRTRHGGAGTQRARFTKALAFLLCVPLIWPGALPWAQAGARENSSESASPWTLAPHSELPPSSQESVVMISLASVLTDVFRTIAGPEEFRDRLIREVSRMSTHVQATRSPVIIQALAGNATLEVQIDVDAVQPYFIPRKWWEWGVHREGTFALAFVPVAIGENLVVFGYRNPSCVDDAQWQKVLMFFDISNAIATQGKKYGEELNGGLYTLRKEVRLKKPSVAEVMKTLGQSYDPILAKKGSRAISQKSLSYALAWGIAFAAVAWFRDDGSEPFKRGHGPKGVSQAAIVVGGIAPLWAKLISGVTTKRAVAMVDLIKKDPAGKSVRQTNGRNLVPVLAPLREDKKFRTHMIVDISFLAKVRKKTEETADVLSRAEEFKLLAAQMEAQSGGSVVFDVLSPYDEQETQTILNVIGVGPDQYNLLFPAVGIDTIVSFIREKENGQTDQDLEEIDKRIIFLINRDWADDYRVADHKGKNYQILLGSEITMLSKMIYSGLMLVNVVLTGRSDQFVELLTQWCQVNGIPMPERLTADINGFYEIHPDVATAQGMANFLNTHEYSQEADFRT